MRILLCFRDALWGPWGAAVLLGAGAFLTAVTGFPQLTFWGRARRILRRKPREDEISPFGALCTALAATVGTGNIIGVTGAICLGGPGAVFWMWICGVLGMATKFAEVTLASCHRVEKNGELLGGPMYVIAEALPKRFRFLATLYCVFGVAAALGVGNATQINAVVVGVNQIAAGFGGQESAMGNLLMGLLLAALIGGVLLGGARRIAHAAQLLVPVASIGYVALCLLAIGRNATQLPAAFRQILLGAFSPRAVTGGMVGSALAALSVGLSRGIFTNEAGMGTASMAYCASSQASSVELGILGLLEVFVDTIVICTLTALAVLCGGCPIPYGVDRGAALAPQVFRAACGTWAGGLLTAFLCVFALATVLGWGLYGARCGQFLFGEGFGKTFALLQMAGVTAGAVIKSQTVWLLAETVNGLMAIPNLIALLLCWREIRKAVLRDQKQRQA